MRCEEYEAIGRAMVEGFIDGLARGDQEAASVADMIRKREARDAALRTFRRAMRRHEKRARRMGLRVDPGAPAQDGLDTFIRAIRVEVSRRNDDYFAKRPAIWARGDRRFAAMATGAEKDVHRRTARMWERAADAVARLRAALAEAT